jgi:toxin HigB-1
MLKTFGDKHTEKLWKEKTSPKWKNIQTVALRKLEQLNKSESLLELTVPPHNRLEALRGKWKGYYSIRINKQYRIVFIWEKRNAYEVEIIDYH